MSPEEIQVRAQYLLRACARAIEQLEQRFATEPHAAKVLRRELGLLFRYWVTRGIWDRLEAAEQDAKELNLALLRLFTEAFALPRDGSGLRYADLSTAAQELAELRQRVRTGLGPSLPEPAELPDAVLVWRDVVERYVEEAISRPVKELRDGPA